MLRYLRVYAALLTATIGRVPFKLVAVRMLEAFPPQRTCSNVPLASSLNVASNIQILKTVARVGGRKQAQLPIMATALFAILLTLPACARVESIDQFGNRKTGWFLASNFDWGDDSVTRVVSIKGIGWHRIGNSGSLGVFTAQVVSMPADCQLIVFNDSKKIMSDANLPADLKDICRQNKK